jgi:hypothetical protein
MTSGLSESHVHPQAIVGWDGFVFADLIEA